MQEINGVMHRLCKKPALGEKGVTTRVLPNFSNRRLDEIFGRRYHFIKNNRPSLYFY